MEIKNILRITIEATEEGHFGAYAENVEGIYGAGDSVEDTKQNVQEGLKLFIENNPRNLPNILKEDYVIVFKYDTQSFLSYYSTIFNMSALEKLTGINQKQLHHYKSGIRKPRKEQAKKIEAALHKLGQELLAVEL